MKVSQSWLANPCRSELRGTRRSTIIAIRLYRQQDTPANMSRADRRRRKTALNQVGTNRREVSGGEPVRLLIIEDEDRLSGILKSKLGGAASLGGIDERFDRGWDHLRLPADSGL